MGGGVCAVGAGLAMAALAQRVAPVGAIDVGEQLGLPPLLPAAVMLHARPTDHGARDVLRVLAAAFGGALQH